MHLILKYYSQQNCLLVLAALIGLDSIDTAPPITLHSKRIKKERKTKAAIIYSKTKLIYIYIYIYSCLLSRCLNIRKCFGDIWWFILFSHVQNSIILLRVHSKLQDMYIIVFKLSWNLSVKASFFDYQEDPRLKYPVHMRNKNSMEPGDLGPLPVSIVIIQPSAYLSIGPQHTLMS